MAQSVLNALTLSNINRFSKFFHCQNQAKICNNIITKDPTTPQVVYEGRHEPFTNLKDLQNVRHDVDDQTVRKAILQWKRRLAAVAKQNGGPIQHIFC